MKKRIMLTLVCLLAAIGWVAAHYSLNIFSEIPFYRLSLYISYL